MGRVSLPLYPASAMLLFTSRNEGQKTSSTVCCLFCRMTVKLYVKAIYFLLQLMSCSHGQKHEIFKHFLLTLIITQQWGYYKFWRKGDCKEDGRTSAV